MADLYQEPTLYGIQDVTVPAEDADFPMRIYYPSDQGDVLGVPIRPGTYPLVAFAHGQRQGGGDDTESLLGVEPGCPDDVTLDHQHWSAMLHLLARCGIVVVAPALHDVVASSETAATRLESAIRWARFEWEHRLVLWGPDLFLDPDSAEFRSMAQAKKKGSSGLADFGVEHLGQGVGVRLIRPDSVLLGTPTNLGLAGHSWGARACARVAGRGQVAVDALASIAGSWDEPEAFEAFTGAQRPTLMMAGMADDVNLSYLPALWPSLVRPKHQAAFQGAGHWDWFGSDGGIQFCDPQNGGRCRSKVWSTASELLVGFMTKYLYNRWQVPPYLLGERVSQSPWGGFGNLYFGSLFCGPRVRWDDPMASPPEGERIWQIWLERAPW
jgi:dienelactone hydrolase